MGDENEIVATLALAATGHGTEVFDRGRGRLEVVRCLADEGLTTVRLRRAVAAASVADGTVRIEVLSKYADPDQVERLYAREVDEAGFRVSWVNNNFATRYTRDRLLVTVGPGAHGKALSLPHVVRVQVAALLGAPMRPGAKSRPGTEGGELYGHYLGDHGRPRPRQPQTVIPAVVAYWCGERWTTDDQRKRRRRAARALNRALLDHEKTRMMPPLVGEQSPGGVFWDRAVEYGVRFERARAFVRDDARDGFVKVLSKAPF